MPDSLPPENAMPGDSAQANRRAGYLEAAAWLALLALSAALHFAALGRRAPHHDESLHAYYSWFIAAGGSYDYTPMLHGPLQFYATAALLGPLGPPDNLTMAAMRTLAAICGTLLPLVALGLRQPFRRRANAETNGVEWGLSPAAALYAGAWIALSPPLLYYGRFFRNDVPFAALGALGIVAAAAAWRRFAEGGRSPALLLGVSTAALGLLLSMKENAVILWFTLFVFLNAWLGVALVRWLWHLPPERWNRVQLVNAFGRFLQGLNIGGLIFLGLYLLARLALPPAALAPTPLFKLAAFTAICYLIFVSFIARLLPMIPGGRQTLPWRAGRFIATGRLGIAAGVGVAILVYMFVFTDMLRVPETPLDVFRRTIGYWMAEHKGQRLGGAFHYYLPLLALYHLPALAICLAGSLRGSDPAARPWRIQLSLGTAVVSVFLLGAWLARWPAIDIDALRRTLHMDSLVHVWIAAMAGLFGMLVAFERLWFGQTLRAFLTIWTLTSFGIYSYAGEKVPWLSVHIALPMLLWAALEGELLARAAAARWGGAGRRFVHVSAAVVLLWSGYNAMRACFQNESNPRERLVFNQTAAAFEEAAAFVADADRETERLRGGEGADENAEPRRLAVRYYGAVVWPLAFSWRGLADAREIAESDDISPHVAGADIVVAEHGVWIDHDVADFFDWVDLPFRQYYSPPLLPLPRMLWMEWRMPPPDSEAGRTYFQEVRRRPLTEDLSGKRSPLGAGEAWRMLWRYYWTREPYFDPNAPGGVWGAGRTAHTVRFGVSRALLEDRPDLRRGWEALKARCAAYEDEKNWTRMN